MLRVLMLRKSKVFLQKEDVNLGSDKELQMSESDRIRMLYNLKGR